MRRLPRPSGALSWARIQQVRSRPTMKISSWLLPHETLYYDANDERSGANNTAGESRGGAGELTRRGCGISVGFLVSGGAEFGDSRSEPRDGDAAGSAAGAGADERGESV